MRKPLAILSALICTISWSQNTPLTIDEAVLGQFRQFAPQTIEQLQWIPNSDTYSFVKDQKLSSTSGKELVLFSVDDLSTWIGAEKLTAMPGLTWRSADQIELQVKEKHYVISVKERRAKELYSEPALAANMDHHYASNRLAYTNEHNLWVQINGEKRQVTNDEKGFVSGQSISRNEYGISKGTFWSPNGNYLAFYKKDERKVTNYPLTDYKATPAVTREIKYPFAGASSEHVSVGIYDAATQRVTYLKVAEGDADTYYLTNLTWSPDEKCVYVAWLNRATTDMRWQAYDAQTGMLKQTLMQEHSDKWLEPEFPLFFNPKSSNELYWITEKDGFNNLYKCDMTGKELAHTKANFEITEFLQFDANGTSAYVMATGENPTESLLYRVDLKTMNMVCITNVHGTHHTQVNASGKYILDQYSNLTTPNRIVLLNSKGAEQRELLQAANPYAGKMIGTTELFTIKSEDGSDLWCRVIKPSNFDPNKKYPVLVYLYGGPHAQMVTNTFMGGSSLWMNYFAEKGYIVFTLDNHGSGHRGRDWEHSIHRQLGSIEMRDQLKGVEWLKDQTWVDDNRMAVHGWSFGGFMTTTLMLRAPEAFRVGVAGGPVIDWSLYEVMYGERYMDTPSENPDGYALSNLTKHTANLKGDLLMIHGTDDDVVVMQHNMRFMEACVKTKTQVDFFAYPGHAHNVRGKDRVHLITKILDYVEDKLAVQP
jgi:dipeptidyl-peptidase 4